MSGKETVGTILAVATERAVNNLRIQLAYGLVVYAQASGYAGPEALDNDIGGPRESVEYLASPRRLQVDGDALLIAVWGLIGRRLTALFVREGSRQTPELT